MHIKDLINNHSEWDIDKISSLTLPYEAQAIQRVHIAGPNHQDSRYWRFEKSGSYSIKTRYWSPFEDNKDNEFNSLKASCSTKDLFLNKIWSLTIPPKIKIFIWKVAHKILGTEANLVRHHVPGDSRCILCGYY